MQRVLAILVLTGRTYRQTRASMRAAALSFSSLLGLGPLVALIVILGTPLLGQRDPLLAAKALDRVMLWVAPQVVEYERLNPSAVPAGAAAAVNPKLVEIIDGFVSGAHRSTIGTFGAVSLVLIVFLLFGSIEHAFNDIWGVTVARGVIRTVAFHLAFLVSGSVLFFSAATLLSAGAFINVFFERLPLGAELFRWFVPLAASAVLAGVLTLAYRLIPNTRVKWSAAATGGAVVTVLLYGNNFLAFLYLRRVLLTRSLYGSLGVAPVLMLGLYVFWLIVLIGGQISFAVQNTSPTSKLGRFSP